MPAPTAIRSDEGDALYEQSADILITGNFSLSTVGQLFQK
jgi:hypothetical protein